MISIVFVDDEPSILQGIKRVTRSMREEWNMHFCEGGEEALALIQEKWHGRRGTPPACARDQPGEREDHLVGIRRRRSGLPVDSRGASVLVQAV